MQRSSVLLPEPDLPSSATTSPVSIVSSAPRRTVRLPNDFHTSRTDSSGASPRALAAPWGMPALEGFRCKSDIVRTPLSLKPVLGEAPLEIPLQLAQHGDHQHVPDRRDEQQRDRLEGP